MKIKKKSLLLVGCLSLIGILGYKISIPAQAKGASNQEQVVAIKNLNLPPNPGIQNNQTKLGIDSNNNGLRDDVEIHIANRYGNDKEKMQKIMDFAKIKQSIFNISVDDDEATKKFNIWRDSEFCLSKKLNIKIGDAVSINNDLVAQVFNNWDRQIHYQDVIIKSDQFGTEVENPECE